MARPKKLQMAGFKKSTEQLAKKLSKAVADCHYLDRNSDRPVTTWCPLEQLAKIGADPKLAKERPEIVVAACRELASYLFVKQKPAESATPNQAQQVIVNGPSGEDHPTDGIQRIQVRTFAPLERPALTDDRDEDKREAFDARAAGGAHQAPQFDEDE
jgi:hypothetical protein